MLSIASSCRADWLPNRDTPTPHINGIFPAQHPAVAPGGGAVGQAHRHSLGALGRAGDRAGAGGGFPAGQQCAALQQHRPPRRTH